MNFIFAAIVLIVGTLALWCLLRELGIRRTVRVLITALAAAVLIGGLSRNKDHHHHH